MSADAARLGVRRFFRSDWGTLAPTTLEGGGPTFENDYVAGFQCCMLGPLDQSGGCTITPRQGEYAGQALRVGAGAPLIMPPILGPCIITPDFASTAAAKFSFTHNLDLLFFRCIPNFFSPRPPLFINGSLTSSSGVFFPFSGRTNFSIAIQITGASTPTITLQTHALYGVSTAISRVVFTAATVAANTVYTYSLDPGNPPASDATDEYVMNRVDGLSLSTDAATVNYAARITDY